MSDIDQARTPNLEAARLLQAKLDAAQLRILEDRARFDAHELKGVDDWRAGDDALKDPQVVAADAATQLSFLRKLKVQYLEQNAKDKYIKTIVSDIDDTPLITAASNEKVRAINEQRKARLKDAKVKLAEKHRDIRTLGPLVEQDYNKAKSLINEVSSLADKILDARLALTRLRKAHPHPRLTVASANAKLDAQIAEMQTLDGELQEINGKVAHAKERVKEGAKEVERLRMERADVEKEAKAMQMDAEDESVAELYDWYTSSLALHRCMLSLHSSHSASENELRLTYIVNPEPHPPAKLPPPREITITLLFLPNTRQLAAAHVQGTEFDFDELIGSHVERNDVPGLIAAIVSRAKYST